MSELQNFEGVWSLAGLQSLPAEPRWFAVQTRARHEKKAAAEISRKGFTAFLPLLPEIRQWSDRRQKVDLPLFPQYVFVRLAPSAPARVSVLQTNGVACFVGSHGFGTPIPDEEIDSVQALFREKASLERCSFLKAGQRVRIRGGSLDGVTGILSGIQGGRALIVSVGLIQRSVALKISGYQVEPA
ncbi:MAG TPA: UpxY family transcription antiterminator [Verrucomicrobiae bacterium]|nr:UpxY family transcription antiterminator [Verrucomicrobiae bacterium]